MPSTATTASPGSPTPTRLAALAGAAGAAPRATTWPSGAAPASACWTAWTQLPLPQRSAFLLHHDDGLALDEVARALEVGFETAKTRLRYAMSKLRTCMGAYLAPRRQR